ncbi:MAG: FliH/SctL family protein [Myxococcota bacterium]|nr:FliH/SctL family protein [Myxococcota bacterium]
MHKLLNKEHAVAILQASKGQPKRLLQGAEEASVTPLFSGTEVIKGTLFGLDQDESSNENIQQTHISPALLGGDEYEEAERELSQEEREAEVRREVETQLTAEYQGQIEQLQQAIETERQTAQEIGIGLGIEKGFQDGYAKGLSQGREEGATETSTKFNEQLTAHAELVKALQTERDDILSSARGDAIELAIRLTERLVGARLKREDVLRSRLEQALDAVSDGVGDPIYVKVAPSQVDVFKKIAQRTALHESDLYIEPDEGLAVGDLIVESCGRRVSSILKEQLERLEEVLYE